MQNQDLVLLGNGYSETTKAALMQTASALGYKMIPADIAAFKSKERFCELKTGPEALFVHNQQDITGARVHVVMSMKMDPNKFFFDTINTVETLKQYGARSVHLILPFVPFSRQDRVFDKRMVSVMAQTFPKHLKAAGADQITTFDVHSKAAEAFYTQYFGRQNVHFISAAGEIIKAVKNIVNDNRPIKEGAPDGADKPDDVAQRKAREVCRLLHGEDCDPQEHMFGIIKGHTGVNQTEVKQFIGNVQDVVALEIDDMTDTGGTLEHGAATLREHGAQMTIAAVTHAFFSGNSLEKLTSPTIENPIDHLLVTDSILGVSKKVRKLSTEQQQRVTIVPTLPLIQQALALNF